MTLGHYTFNRIPFGLVSAALLLSSQMPLRVEAQSIDLTGLWKDDTGGGATYRIRQVGNRVYWIVDGSPMGSFVNLSYGEISGNTITGIWVDLPNSPSLGGGNLTLRIESNDRLVKVNSSTYYAAQTWTRQGSPGGNANPPAPPAPVGHYLTVRLNGSDAIVDWSNAPTTNGSWVSVVPVGTSDQTHTGRWVYTQNKPSGTYQNGPLGPGDYEARFYADGGYDQLVDRVRFRVAESVAKILRVQVDGRASAVVTWSNAPTSDGAWVSVVPVGTSVGTHVGKWTYTNQTASGSYESGPLTAGEYEARFYGDGGYSKLLERVVFKVP